MFAISFSPTNMPMRTLKWRNDEIFTTNKKKSIFWERSKFGEINRKLMRVSREANRTFPHSTSVRTNNSTTARLGWTYSYIIGGFRVFPESPDDQDSRENKTN